jgi:MoxR-like ATPase
MSYVFDRLGIYGLEREKENAILASLLTGDPALLIGKQGTAKTAIVEAIGNAFRERSKRLIAQGKEAKLFEFRIYDASKIQFEDLSGFPNPHAMSNGKMGYIQTPMTAWNADLIAFDEFSRQSPERQNNIFELIRSRRLQGEPTGTTWIFNCMNPLVPVY